MQPMHIITGTLLSLPLDNVDTDQIIPARFMYRSRREGYGDVLLHDLRGKEGIAGTLLPALAGHAPASIILLAGANFGCGSSREAAVYALLDAGIKAIVAPGFGDIFRNNCYNNGLLPVTLDAQALEGLGRSAALSRPPEYTIDIVRQTLVESRTPQAAGLHFDMDPSLKRRMVEGLDNIDLTLQHQGAIDAFEKQYAARRPWVFPAR